MGPNDPKDYKPSSNSGTPSASRTESSNRTRSNRPINERTLVGRPDRFPDSNDPITAGTAGATPRHLLHARNQMNSTSSPRSTITATAQGKTESPPEGNAPAQRYIAKQPFHHPRAHTLSSFTSSPRQQNEATSSIIDNVMSSNYHPAHYHQHQGPFSIRQQPGSALTDGTYTPHRSGQPSVKEVSDILGPHYHTRYGQPTAAHPASEATPQEMMHWN